MSSFAVRLVGPTFLACLSTLLAQPSAGPVTFSAEVRVTAPTLGRFVDVNLLELRRIQGMAGSGFVSQRSKGGAQAARIEVSPSQEFALGIAPDTGMLVQLRFDDEADDPIPVMGALRSVSRIAISPSGKAALVYADESRRAQVLSGFPAAGAVIREMDWTGLPGVVSAIAIDDSAEMALVAVSGETASVYSVALNSSPALSFRTKTVSNLQFLRDTRTAIVGASAENQVVTLVEVGGVFVSDVLADERSGISSPVAVAASNDGLRVFALNRSGEVLMIPTSGGKPAKLVCECQVVQLQRLRGREVFLLTASLDAPLAVVDFNDVSAGVRFIQSQPPLEAVAKEERQ